MMGEWISVKDRMPEDEQPVLVVYSGVVQNVVYAKSGNGWIAANNLGCDSIFDSDWMPLSFVTHWQSLPDPPAD